jgi:hypothetical protein
MMGFEFFCMVVVNKYAENRCVHYGQRKLGRRLIHTVS